ncbi:MAG: TonB-dependent receptor [Hyphomonadaceae bacterium]|jgi:iron complex outermembrane receptor protein|nr:TonB-dependent receptor [Hyphomonadaceae bacterium]
MRKFGDKARIALLLASVAASPFALAAPSYAQDTVTEEEELVVTARRTEESLQEVPASVSAFSEQQLQRLGATDATGLQGAVPNLNIVQGRGSSNATNIYIRGVGQPDALQTFDPAVGFYVDGVYYSRIRGTQMDLLDIERVEVLRGPQGTLYGKNTIGGAYSIITRRPGQDPHGLFQVTAGDYGQLESRIAASGPLTDTLAIGGALFGASRDGYVTNPVTNEEYNNRNAWGGRFQAAWDPASNFNVDFSVDYAEEDNALTMGQAVSSLTTIVGVPIPAGAVPSPLPEFNFTARATPGLPNSSEMTHWGSSLRASWELSDNLTLRSISAYRNLNYTDYVDIDATFLELGDVLVDVDQDQVSQEFQAIWEGDRWTTIGGLFYLRENVGSHQEAYADDLLGTFLGGGTFTRTVDDDLQTTSMAAYVNATYQLTDRLSVSGGLRYTEEEKDYFRTTSTFSSNALFTANPARPPVNINDTWDDISGLISIDYQLTDDFLLYGRVAQGFKSGGFNGRANNPGEEAPYDPETVTSYEAGFKSDWFDNTLRANFAVFYNDYRDFQARVSNLTTDPGSGLPSIELTVLNAGQLEISGAELELSYRPVEALTLDAQIGYLNAEYGEFEDLRFTSFGNSRAFQTPAFSPEWTSRFGAAYTWDVGAEGSVVLAGSARFRSRQALAVDNTITNSTTEIAGLFQDDYWLYDASLTWNVNDIFSIAVQGRNLSDEVYKTDGQEFSSVGNIRTVYYGAPQTTSIVFTARY